MCFGACAHRDRRVYNLVGDEDTTILQIAHVVRDLVGDVSIVHGPERAGDFRGAQVSGACVIGLVCKAVLAAGRLALHALRRPRIQASRGL